SCSTDRSGMNLLPNEISADIAKKMIGVETSQTVTDENGNTTGSHSTATGSDIYTEIMKRYPEALSKDGKTPANGLMILPFLAAGMQLLSSIVMMRRNKKDGQTNEQAKSMNTMMYFMPIMSILICMSSTTAFAFYWTVSGVIQFVSSLIINAVFDKKKAKINAEAK
ncbi:MAG: YidC/Oxa1 family membrane protein insertase, partial [Clostridia bacterium]|nr:YidC/Oxa1 family membrane protein insertase [Clostridia bacterium]